VEHGHEPHVHLKSINPHPSGKAGWGTDLRLAPARRRPGDGFFSHKQNPKIVTAHHPVTIFHRTSSLKTAVDLPQKSAESRDYAFDK
jgi:hypothetical protein